MEGKDLSIFNPHTGVSVQTNRYYFVSLDELKKFCSKQFNIPYNQVFLITPFGIKLKSSILDEIDEVYAFDRNLFSHDNENYSAYLRRYLQAESLDNFESLLQPINSPLFDIDLPTITKNRNPRQLVSLLTTNLGWVAAIESDSTRFSKKAVELRKRIQVLFKSLKVASQYVDGYCAETVKIYRTSNEYADELQRVSLTSTWKEHYDRLENIHLINNKSLSSLLSVKELNLQSDKASNLSKNISNEFQSLKPNIAESDKQRSEVSKSIQKLESESQELLGTFDAEGTLSEISLLSKKVQQDTRNLLDRSNINLDNFDLDIILETFERHKRDFVNQIYEPSYQLYQYLLKEKDLYYKLQLTMAKLLQSLSLAQSKMLSLRESVKDLTSNIEEVQTYESTLANTVDLPLLYGLYLIESLRRKQWVDEMKSISSKTNESFAGLREKEVKFRSNWVQRYGTILGLLKCNISSFNSNNLKSFEVISNEDKLSMTEEDVVYDDCVNYIQELQKSSISKEVINLLISELDNLSSKKPASFFSKSSTSKSDNELIKGYVTRIRKLESLLHQEQFKNSSQNWSSSISRTNSLSKAPRGLDSVLKQSDSGRPSRSASPTQQIELSKLTNENEELKERLRESDILKSKLNDEILSSRKLLSAKEQETQTLSRKLQVSEEQREIDISSLQASLTEERLQQTKQYTTIKEQQETIESLKKELEEKSNLINDIKNELSEKEKDFESKAQELKSKDIEGLENKVEVQKEEINKLQQLLSEKTRKGEELSTSLEDKDLVVKELNKKFEALEISKDQSIDALNVQITELSSEKEKLVLELKECKEDFVRLKVMKNDLLENMSNRENEFAKEKGAHQEEVESLRLKVEELETLQQETQDLQASELEKKTLQTVVQLVIIIDSLLIKCRDLSDILFTIYQLMDESLKQMGMLAVESIKDGTVDIRRVRGLRNRTSESINPEKLGGYESVLANIGEGSNIWTQIPDSQLIARLNSASEDIDIEALESICDSLITTYNLTTFEDKYLKFVSHMTNLNLLYVPSISMRFKEVEHLAKKEMKLSRQLEQKVKNKISIRNFEVGDLILFLPTRNQNSNEQSSNQWAAFNNMGDVKYLLKNDLGLPLHKQWFIGRILNIETVGSKDFAITAEEVLPNN